MKLRFFFLALIFVSCSPNSKEEWRLEGANISRDLIESFKEIHSLDELERKAPRIKKKFNKLVDLVIAAKKYHMKHPDEEESKVRPELVNELLKAELIRIYQIDGCQPYLEEIERDSLHKLDQFAKKLQKVDL